MGPIDLLVSLTRNRYIITTTNYTTKLVEVRALRDNIPKSTRRFLYEEILTYYRCPIELINNQEVYFINEII